MTVTFQKQLQSCRQPFFANPPFPVKYAHLRGVVTPLNTSLVQPWVLSLNFISLRKNLQKKRKKKKRVPDYKLQGKKRNSTYSRFFYLNGMHLGWPGHASVAVHMSTMGEDERTPGGESDWPDLPWIFGNQYVCLAAGDGVDWQLHRRHHEALADRQPQALAQTVEGPALAPSQNKNVNHTTGWWDRKAAAPLPVARLRKIGRNKQPVFLRRNEGFNEAFLSSIVSISDFVRLVWKLV